MDLKLNHLWRNPKTRAANFNRPNNHKKYNATHTWEHNLGRGTGQNQSTSPSREKTKQQRENKRQTSPAKVIITLIDFKSRWIQFFECKYSIPKIETQDTRHETARNSIPSNIWRAEYAIWWLFKLPLLATNESVPPYEWEWDEQLVPSYIPWQSKLADVLPSRKFHSIITRLNTLLYLSPVPIKYAASVDTILLWERFVRKYLDNEKNPFTTYISEHMQERDSAWVIIRIFTATSRLSILPA